MSVVRDPRIAEVLDRLLPATVEQPDWQRILADANTAAAGRPRRPSRRRRRALRDVRARATRGHTSGRTRRSGSARVRMAAAALLFAATAGGVVAVGLSGWISHTHTHRPATVSASTDVRTLLAFTRNVRAVRAADLPPGVSELMNEAKSRFGETVTNIQEPIAGTASIYLVTLGSNQLCTYIAIKGATGRCRSTLDQADGSLDSSLSIVDRKLFVSGVAANDISSITVSIGRTATTAATTTPVQAKIADNVFLTPALPFNGMSTGPITITATHTDGSTSSATLPGIPRCRICAQTPTTTHR